MRRVCWLLLGLLGQAAWAITLSTGDGLSVEWNDRGQVTGLTVNERPALVVPEVAAWQVTDVGRGRDDTEWLSLEDQWPAGNELHMSGALWRPGNGWQLSGRSPRKGAAAQWSADRPSYSDAMRLVFPAMGETVYTVRLTCRATGFKGAIRLGALPLNGLGQANGAWVPGEPQSPAPPADEWYDLTVVVAPPPGSAMVEVWLSLEQALGRFEVAGAQVTAGSPGPLADFDGLMTADESGAHYRGAADDLTLAVDYQPQADGLRFRARLSTTGTAERALVLRFAVPLEGTGWNWWDDLDRRSLIGDAPGQRLANWRQLGQGHLYSPFPLACISRSAPAQGVALAVPLAQPVLSRLSFDTGRGLLLSCDLGLAPAAGQAQATVEGVLYAADGAWGLRSAVERYQRIYAAAYHAMETRAGAWFSGVNPQMITSPGRFGLLFDEQPAGHLSWSRSNDLRCLAALMPWGLFQRDGPAGEVSAGGVYPLDGVGRQTMPAGGDLLDAAQQPVSWTSADGVTFRPWCTSPGLAADGPAGRMNALLAGRLVGEDGKRLDGVALDGVGAAWAGWGVDDHSAAHLALARAPLSCSRLSRRPVVLSAVGHAEYLAQLAARLHDRKQPQMVLGHLDDDTSLPFVAPWLDVLSVGTGVPDDERLMWARVVAGSKPLTFRDPLLLDTVGLLDERHDCWRQALLWAAFPGTSGWLSRRSAEAQAPLFDAIVPLLRALAGAGWQPVPYALLSDASLRIERYGSGQRLLLVVANNTERNRTATLTLAPQPLGLTTEAADDGARRLVFVNRLSQLGRTVEFRSVLDRLQASITVPARSAALLAPLTSRTSGVSPSGG